MFDSKKLVEAHAVHRKALETPRRFQKEAHKLMLGKWFGEGGASKEQPKNHLERATTIHRIHLATSCPQATVSSDDMLRDPESYELQLALNYYAKKVLGLGNVLERWALAAISGIMGVVEVGVERVVRRVFDGQEITVGVPYAINRLLDDYVFDTAAEVRSHRHFESSRFSVRYDQLVSTGLLTAQAQARAKTVERDQYDVDGADRTENAAYGTNSERQTARLYKMFEGWKVYLPGEGKLAIYQADEKLELVGAPLAVVDWEGPECGPNHELFFIPVEGCTFGLPLHGLWRGLHETLNYGERKMARQAERQKLVPAFRGSNAQDAVAINTASDGVATNIEDPESYKEVICGGVHQGNFAFYTQKENDADVWAGGLSILGGTQPQTETYKQDKLLKESASERLNDMKNKMVAATSTLMQSLAWHIYHEPGLVLPITKRAKGIQHTVNGHYTHESRTGVFDFDIDVDAHSMAYRTPEAMVRDLDEAFQITMEAAASAAGQGVVPDLPAYLKARARLKGNKWLEDLVTFADPPAEDSGAAMPGPSGPPTHSIYERRSRGSNTAGAQQSRVAAMMAGNSAGGDAAMM